MNDSPVIHADIGDGKQRRFFLGADELKQIKRECGRSWFALYQEFGRNADQIEVQAVLRLALIGGGMPGSEASELVQYYCFPPRPLQDAYLLAYDCLSDAWKGVKTTGKGRSLSVEEMDAFFDDLEADLIRKGHSPEIIKGKSFAEIQGMLARLSEGGESPAAPDEDMFAAMKKAAGK